MRQDQPAFQWVRSESVCPELFDAWNGFKGDVHRGLWPCIDSALCEAGRGGVGDPVAAALASLPGGFLHPFDKRAFIPTKPDAWVSEDARRFGLALLDTLEWLSIRFEMTIPVLVWNVVAAVAVGQHPETSGVPAVLASERLGLSLVVPGIVFGALVGTSSVWHQVNHALRCRTRGHGLSFDYASGHVSFPKAGTASVDPDFEIPSDQFDGAGLEFTRALVLEACVAHPLTRAV